MATLDLTTTTTLNDGSLTVHIYEDVGDDGSGGNSATDADGNSIDYDNTDSIALSGGTDESNTTADVFDGGSGNGYYVRFVIGTLTNPTDTPPTVDSWELDTGTGAVTVAAPNSLTIASTGVTTVDAEATDNSTTEDVFRLYQSPTSPVTTGDTLADTTTTPDEAGTGSTIPFNATGLSPTTQYFFAATAFDSDTSTESSLSNEVNTTTLDQWTVDGKNVTAITVDGKPVDEITVDGTVYWTRT